MISDNDFICCFCLEYAKEAVETLCCGTILCANCAAPLRQCPKCRKDSLQTRPSGLARKIIASLPVDCQNCGHKTSVSELN